VSSTSPTSLQTRGNSCSAAPKGAKRDHNGTRKLGVCANAQWLFTAISTPRSSLRPMSAHLVSWYVFFTEASGARRSRASRRAERRSEGKVSTEIIRVTVEIRDGALSYRVCVTAPSIERALEIAGDGMPGRHVRLLFPIDPETFFVPEDPGRREAA
jgi:hypothetical protein